MSETEAKDSEWVLPSADVGRNMSAATCDSPLPVRREAALKSASKTSVLIVEDDRSARTAIARLLARQGFAVSEAGTVAQAVTALSDAPHWILLDLMLP